MLIGIMVMPEKMHIWTRPLLAALVALCLLIPTWDAFRCVADFAGENGISVSDTAVKAASAQASNTDGKQMNVDQDADPLCPHGHCHHLTGIPSAANASGAPVMLAYFEPFNGTYIAPTSPPPLGLLRPPRA